MTTVEGRRRGNFNPQTQIQKLEFKRQLGYSLTMRRIALRLLIPLVLLLASSLLIAPPVQAATCRQTSTHKVCILSIERSAKNYWEYRAAVTVDQEARPVEVYNCREQIRIKQDGTTVKFEPNGAGDVICHLFQR